MSQRLQLPLPPFLYRPHQSIFSPPRKFLLLPFAAVSALLFCPLLHRSKKCPPQRKKKKKEEDGIVSRSFLRPLSLSECPYLPRNSPSGEKEEEKLKSSPFPPNANFFAIKEC